MVTVVATMLEQQSKDLLLSMSSKEKEICVLQDQISKLKESKCATDDEVLRLRSVLSEAKVNQEQLSQELQSTKLQHQHSQNESRTRIEKEYASEIKSYKSTIKEQSLTLKEYQNKVH